MCTRYDVWSVFGASMLLSLVGWSVLIVFPMLLVFHDIGARSGIVYVVGGAQPPISLYRVGISTSALVVRVLLLATSSDRGIGRLYVFGVWGGVVACRPACAGGGSRGGDRWHIIDRDFSRYSTHPPPPTHLVFVFDGCYLPFFTFRISVRCLLLRHLFFWAVGPLSTMVLLSRERCPGLVCHYLLQLASGLLLSFVWWREGTSTGSHNSKSLSRFSNGDPHIDISGIYTNSYVIGK